MNNLTFGSYYPAKSVLHSLDPRTKILLSIIFMVAVFMCKNFVALGAAAVILIIAISLSSVPLRSVLKSIRGIMFLIIFAGILNLFFYDGGEPILTIWFIVIKDKALFFTLFMAARLIIIVMGTSMLTLTTTPVALTNGIESLLKPLNLVKFPVHEMALIMSIALRYIPTLMDEANRIISAQKARGGDFETGGLIKRARALIPILIPLLISSLKRADELTFAMEARCYNGGKGRTKYRKLQYKLNDFICGFCMVSFMFGVIAINTLFAAI